MRAEPERKTMDLKIGGKGALIVGATGDTGRAVVDLLLAEGARVVVSSRSRDRLNQYFASGSSGIAGIVPVDLNDDESISAAVAAAETMLGGVDILICTAAGDVAYGPIWTLDRTRWMVDLGMKLVGTAQVCVKVAERMATRKDGVIVNVIGIATDMVVTNNPVGSAGNSGLKNFTRVLAAELAQSGIRVIGISPGMIAGQRLNRFAGDKIEAIRQTIPIGRIGRPEEYADVIVFAASPRSSYITGEIITVDGGLTLVR